MLLIVDAIAFFKIRFKSLNIIMFRYVTAVNTYSTICMYQYVGKAQYVPSSAV